MLGWTADNRDYLFFVLGCAALFGFLEAWLRHRRPSGRLPFIVWPALAALLTGGWFLVSAGGRQEGRRIQGMLEAAAPTYAQEITRMGHASLMFDTPPDDPTYLAIIEAMKRWLAVNPHISDIYTFRNSPEGVRFVVDSETDYNHDGKYEGEREERTPIGQKYPQADEGMVQALAGKASFADVPVADEWGVWVSASVPLYDAQGRVEGALGLDYPAEEFIGAIAMGRERMIWLLAVPVLMLGFGSATAGALRAEIATRRGVEDRLRESEARLRTIIDCMPCDLWAMDMGGRYILTNAAARRQGTDYIGKTLAELELAPETRAAWERSNRLAFAGETVRSEILAQVDGQRRFIHTIVAPVRVGERIVGILGLNVDLTDRADAEEALRKSERRFALHVRQTPLAVIEWDTDFKVTAWNPAAERIFGYAAAEVLGKNAASLIVGENAREHVEQVWQAIIAQRGGSRSTNENLTKDGRVILCDWYNTPLIDDSGRVIGVASHCEDITQRESLEKHLRQTQKIESLGQLAAGVAHEFNNLLTPMLLRLEMLRMDRADDSDLLAALRSIEDAIDQAAQLNQRILAVGRRSVEKREMLALNPVVDDTLGLLRHTLDRRIVLDVRLSPGMGPLMLDRAQVAQIVVNLVLNARDAVLEKAKSEEDDSWTACIVVSTDAIEASPPAESGATSRPPRRRCQRLTVIDNGAGMSAEVRAHIFEPFYTTKSPGHGTGLGLAVVWNVVKNLDGWIDIVSTPGMGTTFHVYFPVPAAPEAAAPNGSGAASRAVPETGKSKLRVLLVDDNASVGDTIGRLLGREGHAVTRASNGEEAWALCDHGDDAFDLIVTDQNMPGMTGTDLIRRLREGGSKVRVVVVSAHLAPDLLKELESLDVTGLLAKPFTQRELLAQLQAAVSASRARSRPSAGRSV
ncbi:MAG TPA: PAS domain S-box protein [Rariglobus sp.]